MDWTWLIGIVATISGILLGWIGRTKSAKKEIEERAKEGAIMRSDIDYIKKGVDELREDVGGIHPLNERVARVEESAKSLHKRVDRLEGKQGG